MERFQDQKLSGHCEPVEDNREGNSQNLEKIAQEKKPIVSYLRRGKENAVRTLDLLRLSGYRNTRSLQLAISKEREAGGDGVFICSSGTAAGYYLPKDLEEYEEYLRSMESRAKSIFRVIAEGRARCKGMTGQLVFEFEKEGYEIREESKIR